MNPISKSQNPYTILNLAPPPTRPPSPRTLKRAYHTALLRHHPDKKTNSIKIKNSIINDNSTTTANDKDKDGTITTTKPLLDHSPTYSIDSITTAYQIISSPALRNQLNRSVLLSPSTNQPGKPGQPALVGGDAAEQIDLDDMNYGDSTGDAVWFRGCRCGTERAYELTEEDLEMAIEEGTGGGRSQVLVACQDCSLWICVGFGVVD